MFRIDYSYFAGGFMVDSKSQASYKLPYKRERDDISLLPVLSWTYSTKTDIKNQSSTATSVVYRVQPTLVGIGRAISDTVTPGYQKLVNDGKIVNNPYSSTHVESNITPVNVPVASEFKYLAANPPSGTIIYQLTSYSNYGLTSTSNFLQPSISSYDAKQANAINEAFANAKQLNVMGLVDLAEMGKTIDLIRSNLGRFESLVRRLPRRYKFLKPLLSKTSGRTVVRWNKSTGDWVRVVGKAKTIESAAADAANLWLEYHYGLVPLMLTIEGLVKTFGNQVSKATRLTFRGSDSFNDSRKLTKVTTSGAVGGGLHTYNWVTDYKLEAVFRAGLLTTFKPTVAQQLGLTTDNLPTTMYELIPFSFVLDWVFDIGTYLEAIKPTSGFTTDASWFTIRQEVFKQYTMSYPGYSYATTAYSYVYQPYAAYCTESIASKIRTVGVSPTFPSLDTTFKSTTHLVSAIALIFSNTRGRMAARI